MSLPHKEWKLFEPDVSDYRSAEDQQADPGPAWFGGSLTYVQLHQSVWDGILEEWDATVLAYETDPGNFYNAWYYLDEHPVFWQRMVSMKLPPSHVSAIHHNGGVSRGLDVSPYKNVETGEIQMMFEVITTDWDDQEHAWHDWFLDDAASSYELMIVDAARKVWDYFGNDMSRRPPVEMGMEWLEENGFIDRKEDADGPDEDAREASVEREDGTVAPDADR